MLVLVSFGEFLFNFYSVFPCVSYSSWVISSLCVHILLCFLLSFVASSALFNLCYKLFLDLEKNVCLDLWYNFGCGVFVIFLGWISVLKFAFCSELLLLSCTLWVLDTVTIPHCFDQCEGHFRPGIIQQQLCGKDGNPSQLQRVPSSLETLWILISKQQKCNIADWIMMKLVAKASCIASPW